MFQSEVRTSGSLATWLGTCSGVALYRVNAAGDTAISGTPPLLAGRMGGREVPTLLRSVDLLKRSVHDNSARPGPIVGCRYSLATQVVDSPAMAFAVSFCRQKQKRLPAIRVVRLGPLLSDLDGSQDAAPTLFVPNAGSKSYA